MENQQQKQTSLCRSGCGFYGSSVTDGLCSRCFKDSVKRTQDTTTARSGQSSTTTTPKPITSDSTDTSTTSKLSATASALTEQSSAAAAATIKLEEAKTGTTQKTARASLTSLSATGSSSSLGAAAEIPSSSSSSSGAEKKPNRCHVCRKRVGLTGFECRCGGLYCGEHRYDTAHNCAFDYKTAEREEIRKNNPVVVSDKIQRL